MTARTKTSALLAARGSVFLKAAALTAVTTLIVALMVQLASTRSGYDLVHEHIGELMVAETRSGAELISGHLAFGNAEAIGKEVDKLAEMAGEYFVAITVRNAEGTVLSTKGAAGGGAEAQLAALAEQAMATGAAARAGHDLTVAVPVFYGKAETPVGTIATMWTADGLLADLLSDAAPAMAAAMLISLVLIAGAALLLRRMMGRPLSEVGGAMHKVADGAYQIDVPMIGRNDEIGEIARSLDKLRGRLLGAQQLEADTEASRAEQAEAVERLGEGLTALARGDLTHSLDASFGETYDRLRLDFNATVATLNDIMGSIAENATEIHTRAEEISTASEDLSQRTENQAATLEETAAAMDEMTSSVRHAAESAAEVESVVKDARAGAEESGRVVTEAIGAMSEIKTSSDGISQIIGVIDDIAFQTNLLALNAGVEAARAGEAGRGFAVVASEVRALAQRSSDAAKEIKQLISTSSDQVETGVALVNRTGAALSDIVERVGNIADLISGIATGAQEQSSGLGEINVGVTQLDKVTQQNAAMVEQATAAATTLKQEAGNLQSLVARFDLKAGTGSSGMVGQPVAPERVATSPITPETEFEAALAEDVSPKAPAANADWQDF